MTSTPTSTLVLMDLENHTAADSSHVRQALAQIEAAGEIEPTARRIIASGGGFAARAMFDVAAHYATHCYSYRVGVGIDGADRKLLEDADPERIAERHGRVVIAPTHSIAGNPDRRGAGERTIVDTQRWRSDLPTRTRRMVELATWPMARSYGYR